MTAAIRSKSLISLAKGLAANVGGRLLAATSPLNALDFLVPKTGYALTRGLTFGPEPRQALDLYRPAEGAGPFPAAVFLYGGSWRWGSRGQYRFVGEAMARRGIVTAVADYRLHPEVRFPAFVEDGAAAVAWVKRHVAEHGGDPEAVFVLGHSAGAHTGALLALDPRYLGMLGFDLSDLAGFIGIAGPYAVNLAEYDSVRTVFEDWPDAADTIPLAFARGDGPPMLLMHGLKDTLVDPLNSIRLAEALRAKGASVAVELVPGVGHYRIVAAVAKPFERLAPVADRIARFIHGTGEPLA